MGLKIVADENIPFAREAFGALGEVTLVHGRTLSRELLKGADLLFVRSITKVSESLLAGTAVRFVGTATAGTDHVDEAWLRKAGIAFADAPGCNANSVAEYMTVAWLVLTRRKRLRLRGARLGIIGVGNVGTRVEQKARALGLQVVLNDPPKARETGNPKYRALDEVFDCDIVTCHTPLTLEGPDATHHLAGEAFFARMKQGAWFCNAGRGGMVDTAALLRTMNAGRLGAVALDVWENEPRIDAELLREVDLASPHIAGYSYDGKVNGTATVYEAACRFLGVEPTWNAARAMPPPEVAQLYVDAAGRDDEEVLLELVTRLYPVEHDDSALRRTQAMTPEDRGREFDRLRREYPIRREFHTTRVTMRGASESLRTAAEGLGFQLA